ncbi:MAG: thiamine pyrophosphate-dependent dehydrogenase E1 component subunit alpha, partial [Chloroflexi bacterium]|nr:thiamine pyrophosphate-dependent dehydrogenase E1 component subunit alpha [Chloroflexota bacterium]
MLDHVLSRRLDEPAWALHRQGRKINFRISAMGREATRSALPSPSNGIDYVAPYYRDLAL